MVSEVLRVVDAGGKDINITVEINGNDVIVFTAVEKIAIPQKELLRMMKEFLGEAFDKVVFEPPTEKQWRKDKHNA